MKNKEKYQTLDELNEAFDAFCRRHIVCQRCPLGGKSHCTFAWLELEAKTSISEDMISDLIIEVSNIKIRNKDADRLRIEMCTKLLSRRDKIQEIWQAQDKEDNNVDI